MSGPLLFPGRGNKGMYHVALQLILQILIQHYQSLMHHESAVKSSKKKPINVKTSLILKNARLRNHKVELQDNYSFLRFQLQQSFVETEHAQLRHCLLNVSRHYAIQCHGMLRFKRKLRIGASVYLLWLLHEGVSSISVMRSIEVHARNDVWANDHNTHHTSAIKYGCSRCTTRAREQCLSVFI